MGFHRLKLVANTAANNTVGIKIEVFDCSVGKIALKTAGQHRGHAYRNHIVLLVQFVRIYLEAGYRCIDYIRSAVEYGLNRSGVWSLLNLFNSVIFDIILRRFIRSCFGGRFCEPPFSTEIRFLHNGRKSGCHGFCALRGAKSAPAGVGRPADPRV